MRVKNRFTLLAAATTLALTCTAQAAPVFINILTGGTSGVYYPIGVGAGLVEVDLRMMKALVCLAQINPAMFSSACARHAGLLLKHANNALVLEEDRHKLSAVARPLLR